ncbi:MAG: hypothetical protein IPP25_20460 [Saprospiraceae bacterium]|nr:hypothetical protein [Candidatus Opimibacter skivensis]
METYELRYFLTPDGTELLRTKGNGDGSVPFGTSYDDGERAENLLRRVRNDVIPILKAIHSLTMNLYSLHSDAITYSGYSPYENFDHLTLDEFAIFCKNHLIRFPADYFDIVLNMKIKNVDLFWDVQFLIRPECVWIQDEDDTEEFPVWYLYFGDHETFYYETLDENYSAVMISDIVKWAMELIRSNYNYTIDESK